ncbi:MAG: Rpn family recombination-promoting nuclease/putative transposase [Planctomycetota bacterium]
MEVVRTHDALFRFVFEQPEQMAELLQSQLPPALVAAIDWATLRRLDGTFVDKALQGRVTDLLFEAQLHGAPLLLHVVVDHKSRADWATALQMARYTLRIHDRWLADHPDARRVPPQ